MTTTPARLSYWDGWFPPGGSLSWWGGWFPEFANSLSLGSVLPSTDAGAGTLVLTLQGGARVTFSWATQVKQSSNGKENRPSRLTRPKERYAGDALIIGDDVRDTRALLARMAPLGSFFQLGLPYEGATLVAPALGTAVYVSGSSLLDWAVPGQRVLLLGPDRADRYTGWILAVSGGDITLDSDPGSAGLAGGVIMPTQPVYLDPTQTFRRYQPAEPVETWGVAARNVVFGFQESGTPASLALADPVMVGPAMQGITVYARAGGASPPTIQFSADALTTTGDLDEDASNVNVKFVDGITTAQNIVDLVAGSAYATLEGTYTGTDVLTAGDDEFAPTAMTGGVDGGIAPTGIGATVNTYASRPLYDAGLVNNDTISDSIQTLVEPIDLGGVPSQAVNTEAADWGRHIHIEGQGGLAWQYVKAFLDTVRGSQKAFWLPSYRKDLVRVSGSGTTLTLSGPLLDWFDAPYFRTQLAIQQAGGYLATRAISTVTDNGDGTYTLTLDVALSGASVLSVSWLELVRLESDDVEVTWGERGFVIDLQARVVQR